MKLIAVDSCELPISVALLDEQYIHEKKNTSPISHSSDELTPMLIDLLYELNMTTKSLDAWIVSNGPGSYTGLRIANAIVKGILLAHPHQKVIAISKLDAALQLGLQRSNKNSLMAITFAKKNMFYFIEAIKSVDNSYSFQKGIISKEDIEIKRKKDTFIIGSPCYMEVDLSLTTSHLFDLGKKMFQENKVANRTLFAPQYDLETDIIK